MKKEWSRRELYAHGEPFGDCATQRKLGGGYICGGGGKGSAPPAPDYTAAAEKQGQSSLEAIRAQTAANRPNQYTPWGSTTWTNNNTFDQAGYDKAMADYKASYTPGTEGRWSYGGYGGYGGGGNGDVGGGWSGGEYGGSDMYTPGTPGGYGMAMPDRKAFEGKDNWTQTTTLTPELQRALDSQIKLQGDRSDLAQGFMGRVEDAYSNPFNWGSLPVAGSNVSASQFGRIESIPELRKNLAVQAVQNRVNFDDNPALQGANPQERQRIENALFERMSPIHDQQQRGLDSKLANMGITMGSEAYNREMQRMGDQQSRERFNALEVGGSEMARLNQMALGNRQQMTNEDLAAANLFNQANQQYFNQDLASGQFGNTAAQNQFNMGVTATGFNNNVGQQEFAQEMARSQYQNQLRNAAIQEQMMQRQMPLNEMNALLSGQQVSMPNMPQFNASAAAQPTQYLPAAQGQYQAQLDAFNAQNQSANSFTSGLFGLGGSLGSAAMFAFSDSRLKRIIRRVGETKGVPLYLYKYLGSATEHIGPIAQEVQKIHPEMVKRHHNGYLMVNYTALEA
jgi:hypothetical protein